MHCKVPCNVQPLTARSPHTSRTMRRTTPRTTLGRCSTRTAAPMRRNVSSSLKHTQQHNGTLVPARVPIPCPFGQVASMRNQQAQKGTAQLQSPRANARHRSTFQHTNRSTVPFSVVFPVRSSLVRFAFSPQQARRSSRSNSHQCAVTQLLRGQPCSETS